MKPRRLRVLLIEDWPTTFDELPVELLGRIGHWAPFVSNMSRFGRVPVPKHNSARYEADWRPITDSPELIAIDFRFEKDSTTPGVGNGRQEWRDPLQFPSSHWSPHLDAPNSGILIGAIAMGCAAQSDIPVAVALYSGDTASVASDVSTVLLLGGMMAAAGQCFPPLEEVHPFETTGHFLAELPRNHVSAVICNMWRFRARLLERLGVDGATIVSMLENELDWADNIRINDNDELALKNAVKAALALEIGRRGSGRKNSPDEAPGLQTLFVVPTKIIPLLSRLEVTAHTEGDEALDRALDDAGLEFFDRDGSSDCLDLRSLFLDHLPKTDRGWGMLPLTSVQLGSGLVRAFVEKIYRSVQPKVDPIVKTIFCPQ